MELLLNLNFIHTRSNWLCWKAQEKFQVEFRFCKRIGCSYVTLLTTYLAKKLENIRNQKASQRRHLTTSYFPDLCLGQFFQEYTLICNQKSAFSFSPARNFNKCRPIYVILWKMRIYYRNIWFMKNWNGFLKFKLKKDSLFINVLTKVSWKTH